MTLFEMGASDGSVSLSGLFKGEFASGPVDTDLSALARMVCRGGWPAVLELPDDATAPIPASYIEAFVTNAEGKLSLSSAQLRGLLASMARNVGSAVTQGTLAKDVYQAEKVSASERQQIARGLEFIERHYVATPLHGWDAPIKSPHRLRTKPKWVFADPSLPVALLGVGPERLMENMQLFGQLFEEMCLRDLAVCAHALPNAGLDPLRYYRDSDGLEVDAVIELNDGRWGAIEVKLGANKAADGERSLLRLAKKVAANPSARNPEPSFLAVLTGKTDLKYRTASGVFVFPLTCLAP